ncbi:hypothetical protein GOX01_20800 [Gluconobacter oxydans]|nr:hypothetical protein GOX01_20800 [Gluconobacter oxydans]
MEEPSPNNDHRPYSDAVEQAETGQKKGQGLSDRLWDTPKQAYSSVAQAAEPEALSCCL